MWKKVLLVSRKTLLPADKYRVPMCGVAWIKQAIAHNLHLHLLLLAVPTQTSPRTERERGTWCVFRQTESRNSRLSCEVHVKQEAPK